MPAAWSHPLYRRLQQHLDRMPVGFPPTASGIEIRILEQLFSPEEAEVALALSAIPEPVATIHRRLSKLFSLDELGEILWRMSERGVILSLSPDNHPRGPRYGKLMFAIGIYERQVQRLTAEFERDARQYFAEAFGAAFHAGPTGQMRVVPVRRPVAVERNVARYNDIREFIANSAGPFAAMPCICRKGKDLTGEKCRQTSLRDNCLTTGTAAEWVSSRGMGAEISRAAMLDLLDAADREGLVLQTENTQAPLFICCCCHCCCGVLTTAKRAAQPAALFSTSFQAEVQSVTCNACGICVERCQMEAVRINERTASVDRARCIGCGLCVTTCPGDAMALAPTGDGRRPAAPPPDTQALYTRIMIERYGALRTAAMGLRHWLGLKV